MWYSEDLINKSPLNTTVVSKNKKSTKVTDIYERGFEDNRYSKSNNFEKTPIDVLVNLELILVSILKGNGDDKK